MKYKKKFQWFPNQIEWHIKPQARSIQKKCKNFQIFLWKLFNKVNREFVFADGHHPVFSSFLNYKGPKSPKCDIDFIGCIHLAHYVPSDNVQDSEPLNEYTAARPSFDEEYFEWIDVLESANEARGSYCIVELGAGYGRWSARGYKAAFANGLKPDDIIVVAVEADPKHFKWMHDHFEVNKIAGIQHLYKAVVNNNRQDVDFFIAQPNVDPEDNVASRRWYGQGISNFPWEGATTIKVKSLTLADVIPKEIRYVDLLDIDIQGCEFEVLQSSVEALKLVKRVHIGTHSREIEFKLIELFKKLRWRCIRSYPCNSIINTSFGKISFCDGVQSWVNPSLVR